MTLRTSKKQQILITLALFGLFFSFGSILAGVIFSDGFETYSLGDLVGQGNWTALTGSYYPQVVSESHTGNKGVYITPRAYWWRNAKKIGATTTDGVLSFWFKMNYGNPVNGDTITIAAGNASDWGLAQFAGLCVSGNCANGIKILYRDADDFPQLAIIQKDVWYRTQIEWNANTEKIKYTLDGGTISTTTGWRTQAAFTPFDRVVLYLYGGAYYGGGDGELKMWVDDFAGAIIGGTNPKLEPTNPVDGINNLVDFNDFLINGKVSIPQNNPNTYNELVVNFTERTATSTENIVYIALPNLIANESFDYEIHGVLFSLVEGYIVSYKITGFDPQGKAVVFYHYNPNTYVTNTGTLPPEIIEWKTSFATPEIEDCSGHGITDRLLCEIKNFFTNIFVPSQKKIGELKQNVELIKQKFPVNYLNGAYGFLSDIRTGINSTSTIAMKFLGQAGVVNYSFWEKVFTIGGTSGSLASFLKSFLTFLIVIAFVVWSINFLKRIF